MTQTRNPARTGMRDGADDETALAEHNFITPKLTEPQAVHLVGYSIDKWLLVHPQWEASHG